MTEKSIASNFIYYIFCGLSGAVIAAIVWLFLRLMNSGIELLWHTIPSNFDFQFYPLIVCTFGGLLLGIFQKLTKAVPDELDTVLAKVKRDKFYSYNKVFLLCISALLPLLFGGSIGPEAGLTGIVVGLCYWAGNSMKNAKNKIPELLQIGISATLGAVFYAPLFGLIVPVEERMDEKEKPNAIHTTKMLSNTIAVLCAIGILFLLNSAFGGSGGLPRMGGYTITNTERLWGIPLALLGAVCGLLFIVFEKGTSIVFSKVQDKCGLIFSTTLGGVLLGIVGICMPLVLFSGEESITEIQSTYMEFAPWLLIAVGVVKLLMTNVCIQSGWKGGHFFPVIFCGISIGYGVAMLSGLDLAFCAGVITAGLLGATMKKPLAVTLLLLLCFDISTIPWILLAAFLGSIIPIGKKKIEMQETSYAKE